MRAVSVHPQALVLTSRMWQTNAVCLKSGEEAMLIDSPYFPDELELLPQVLAQAGFEPDALVATHADFDHLLGRLAFPSLALGVGELTAERLRASPGAAQRELRDADVEFYVVRPAPLSLGAVQTLPAPGSVELGEEELEVQPAEGHTSDGIALFAAWCGVLVCGDYLSDVEIPGLGDGGSLDAYRATLARLDPFHQGTEP
ncbi:MAG TPA: MBL fold metallo-hydrolase, partial [Thermoleophilaceae bacterium]|nr:MBL fold metallo-hydrolase [Thermoleophilaceae bacterium]